MMEPLHITLEPVSLTADTQETREELWMQEEPAAFEDEKEDAGEHTEPEIQETFEHSAGEIPEEEEIESEEAENGEPEAAFSGIRFADEQPPAPEVEKAPPKPVAAPTARPVAAAAGSGSSAAAKAEPKASPPRPKTPPRPYQFPPLSLLKRSENKNGQDAARGA